MLTLLWHALISALALFLSLRLQGLRTWPSLLHTLGTGLTMAGLGLLTRGLSDPLRLACEAGLLLLSSLLMLCWTGLHPLRALRVYGWALGSACIGRLGAVSADWSGLTLGASARFTAGLGTAVPDLAGLGTSAQPGATATALENAAVIRIGEWTLTGTAMQLLLSGGVLLLLTGLVLRLCRQDAPPSADEDTRALLPLTALYLLTGLLPALCCVYLTATSPEALLLRTLLLALPLVLVPLYDRAQSAYQSACTAVETEQQYRDEMRSFMNVIRSQRHDYNFHVQTIAALIRQGKVDECLNYVSALEEDTSIMNAILPVRDVAIAAMIYAFRLQAVQQGIALNVSIRYDLSQIATSVYETNKIISNLLQNAIDEVSTQADRSQGIDLNILKRGEYSVIRVSNRVSRPLTQDTLPDLFRQGYTTKRGHDGVGLSSLKTLARRYHGVIYAELEGDTIHVVVRIPIDYTKEVPA